MGRTKITARKTAISVKAFNLRAKAARKAVKKRKKVHFKPGTVALREIRKLQRSTDLLIPFAPFSRLVREIMLETRGGRNLRIQESALGALQEAAECVIIAERELTNLAAIHAKRVTIQVKDMKLLQSMRQSMTGYSISGRNK